MKHEYTEKQKETIRGAAMLIMAQYEGAIAMTPTKLEDYHPGTASGFAVRAAKHLVDKLAAEGLCD